MEKADKIVLVLVLFPLWKHNSPRASLAVLAEKQQPCLLQGLWAGAGVPGDICTPIFGYLMKKLVTLMGWMDGEKFLHKVFRASGQASRALILFLAMGRV